MTLNKVYCEIYFVIKLHKRNVLFKPIESKTEFKIEKKKNNRHKQNNTK